MMAAEPTPLLKDFVLTERLGSGSYGAVYKARRKTGARDVVAVKCVKKSSLSKREIDNIVTEISLLKKLKHDFIVEMKDFSWDNHFIYINMEFCGIGDLSRFIKARKKLPENTCHVFSQQLASALRYLRKNDVAHMDLKPQNILLSNVISSTTTRFKGPILKLADFGFASYFSNDQTKTSLRGSPLYMAPEMVLDHKYDAKVDLWSVGVILFECLFGKAPYKSDTVSELLQKIKVEAPIEIPNQPKLSNPCHDLLARCLQRDPLQRIDYHEFFDHPFLDLEHMPTDESEAKATMLIEKAVKYDEKGKPEEAIKFYGEALEYWLPLFKNERSTSKKAVCQRKVERYIQRAEELKRQMQMKPENAAPKLQASSSSPESLSATSSNMINTLQAVDDNNIEELVRQCSATPQLKLGIEIVQAAESYEREGQYVVALENYERALGILIPLLNTEPKGPRRSLLMPQMKRWMSRAEAVKALMSIQERVLVDSLGSDSIDSEKHCVLQ